MDKKKRDKKRDKIKKSMQGGDTLIRSTTNEVQPTTDEIANEVKPTTDEAANEVKLTIEEVANEVKPTATAKRRTQGKKINGNMKITSIALYVDLHLALKMLALKKHCPLHEIINEVLLKYARREGCDV